MQSLKQIFITHKVYSVIGLCLLLILGYEAFGYYAGSTSVTKYTLAKAKRGTLIVSVSGSGQVSVSNQIDIKPKVSGDITYIGALNGASVRAGFILAQINARDAQKAIRDAQTSLDSAQLALAKLKESTDPVTKLQAENAVTQANESKSQSDDDLKKTYEDSFNGIANTFLDLPDIMTGLQHTLYNYDLQPAQSNIYWYANQTDSSSDARIKAIQYQNDALDLYTSARASYDIAFTRFKATSRDSDTATIEASLGSTYDALKVISDATKALKNYIDFVQDDMQKRNLNVPVAVARNQADLNTYTGKVDTHLSDLLALKHSIANDRTAIQQADRTISEKTASLNKLNQGADPLDIQSEELNVKQRQNALADAQIALADYSIRAPFDGVISKSDIQKGESVSPSTVVASLLSHKRIAQVTLNEVDVAKIKVGQKATLTFDAIPDLSISGEVSDIDVAGTVTQGVVSYTVKIAFDTQDDRVKPGMSVSAAIITDVKPNALLVPNTAVKSQNSSSYVLVPANLTDIGTLATLSGGYTAQLVSGTARQTVEVGLSNDSMTEIISGLQEGDTVISSSITSTTSAATSQSSALRIPGLTGGAGGGGLGGGRGAGR